MAFAAVAQDASAKGDEGVASLHIWTWWST